MAQSNSAVGVHFSPSRRIGLPLASQRFETRFRDFREDESGTKIERCQKQSL